MNGHVSAHVCDHIEMQVLHGGWCHLPGSSMMCSKMMLRLLAHDPDDDDECAQNGGSMVDHGRCLALCTALARAPITARRGGMRNLVSTCVG